MESLRVSGGDFVIEKKGKLRDTYRIGNKLGDGAFGSVRKIIHRVTGEIRAVKTIHKKNSQESLRVGPSPTKRSLESSPSHVSIRLFNQAQEIENHKNEIRKSLIPEYSFTPKLSNGTKK